MKKVLIGTLLLAAFVNSAPTQKSLLGDWTLSQPQAATDSIVSLETDTLRLNADWKFSEGSIYNVNKANAKFKLKVSVGGDYRIEGEAIKKYYTGASFSSEILEGANNADSAQKSLKEIEKIIRDNYKTPLTVISVDETNLDLDGLKYTKPKSLPVSKLTVDTVPFFAPEGWEYPQSAKELSEFPVRLKNDAKHLLTVAKGDFNGDEFADAAAYLINAQTEQVALFVNISKSDGTYEIAPYGNVDKNTIIENGVMLAPAGEYVNSSTKEKITIDTPGFFTIIFDTTAYLVYWDLAENNFKSIPVGKKF